jgi:hypothetical protein
MSSQIARGLGNTTQILRAANPMTAQYEPALYSGSVGLEINKASKPGMGLQTAQNEAAD